jgi:hypothetical protein
MNAALLPSPVELVSRARSPIQKNLAACGLLLLLFFGASDHLAKEKNRLESRVQAFRKESSLALVSGRSRSRSSHERSVADLLGRYGGPMTARELLLAWCHAANHRDPLKMWKISVFSLSQLPFGELMELEDALRKEDGPGRARQSLLHTIYSLIDQHLQSDRVRFFDHVVQAETFYGASRVYFTEWIKEDPEVAMAWFRSLESKSDQGLGLRPGSRMRDEFIEEMRGFLKKHPGDRRRVRRMSVAVTETCAEVGNPQPE